MSYIIRRTDGTTIAPGTILDGTVDNSATSLTLVGRNYSNYGQIMTDNLIKLLENFAYNISPSNPLTGQLWYDKGNNVLKVYTGTTFKAVASLTSDTTAPTTTSKGDMWWDSVNGQLYVYNGGDPYSINHWRLVGPGWSTVYGQSGAIWERITDTLATPHSVLSLYVDGVRTAIISNDPSEFTPSPAITNFTKIQQGYNIASTGTYWGTANNASYLGNQPAVKYLRTDIDNSVTGNLTIVNDDGVSIGIGNDLRLTVDGIDATVRNSTVGGDLKIGVNRAGTPITPLQVDGGTGEVIISELNVTDNIPATSTTTGAVVVTGGVGIGGDLHVGGAVVATSITGNAQGTATTITQTLPVTKGGTNATSVSQAQINLQLQPNVNVQSFNVNLWAIGALNSSGLLARVGTGVAAARSIAAGTNISVTNGNGAAGDPTISIANSPSFTGEPRSTTPLISDRSTRIATTAWVRDAISTYGAFAYWADNTTPANAKATYAGTPTGTLLVTRYTYTYTYGTGNGGTATATATALNMFIKVSSGNSWVTLI